MAGYGNGLRRAIMLSGVLALAAGACDANRAGGHDVALKHAHAVATPLHRRSESPVVQFVVESSGDLLIHSPVWERALVLGGGRQYNFAPLLARIKPYIRRADLALCHVETPMTPAPPTSYPVFNTPPNSPPQSIRLGGALARQLRITPLIKGVTDRTVSI